MAKMTVDELQVLITANAASFNKQLQAVQRQLDGVGKQAQAQAGAMTRSFSAAKVAAAAAIAAIGVAVGKMVTASTRQFGDFEQNVGGAKAIYGEYAGYVQKKAWEAARTMGMSMNEYMQTANKIGAIMQGSGMDQASALKMTTEWMQRAADQASVMGVTTREAMEAITGAAKGNFMMMDNIGVKMNATTLEAYALSKGISTAFDKMSEAQKVGLAYELFMERTGYAMGNFAREGATTMNGALATLRASFANLGAMMGQAFAPVVMQVANFVSTYLIPALASAVPYVMALMNVIGQMVSYVGSLLSGLFGGSGTEAVQSVGAAADSTAASVNKVGAAAGGAGKALGGAAKQAKKLKGQLAGFDEMNVLPDPQSSSSGGGGAGGGGGGAAPNFKMPKMPKFNPFEGMDKRAKDISDKIKKIFAEMFDLDKIGKAFARFWDDIKKGAAPVFRVITDIWKSYLQPFLSWAGNSLLPAFLNALGGAIQFVGSVIGSVWNAALKPFVDIFLVPLAHFTGGVIVAVLNAIGDALRWIASNEIAMAIITGIAVAAGLYATAIAAVNAATAAYQLIQGVVTGLQLAMNGALVAGATGTTAFAAGINLVTAAQTIWQTLTVAFNPVLLVLTATIGAVVAAVGFLTGAFSSNTNEKELNKQKTEELRAKMTEEQRQIDTNKDGVIQLSERIRDLTNAKLEATNATLARIRAQRDLEAAESKYLPIINDLKSKTNLTAKEQQLLEEAEASLEQAQYRLAAATDKEKTAKSEATEKTRGFIEQQKQATIKMRGAELAAKANAGAIQDIERALNPAIVSVEQYRDQFGNMRNHTIKDSNEIRQKVIENFNATSQSYKAELDKSSGHYRVVAKRVGDFSSQYSAHGNNSGTNFQTGVQRGINNNQWRVNQAARGSALGAKNEFNRTLGIHSPSRVMMKSGGWFTEGAAEGILAKTSLISEAARKVAERASEAFSAAGSLEFGIPELPQPSSIMKQAADQFAKLGAEFSVDVAEERPIALSLNIDSENIPISAQRIADSLNDAAFLQNSAMVNI